jgi:hypothetical protein
MKIYNIILIYYTVYLLNAVLKLKSIFKIEYQGRKFIIVSVIRSYSKMLLLNEDRELSSISGKKSIYRYI